VACHTRPFINHKFALLASLVTINKLPANNLFMNKNWGIILAFAIFIILILVVIMVPANNQPTDPAIASVGDQVTVHYVGTLEDGTVFDSSIARGEPIVFELGAGRVIPGWEEGILGMKVGDQKQLIIPPEKAYGADGVPGVIPPDATLTFEVELLAIN
jgi:hypothetical protein